MDEESIISQNRIERNYGIDALRIYSMFLVVILHVLGHGGVLENAIGLNSHIAWLIKIFVFCAVDIYALISGYVGYTNQPKTFRTESFLTLWTQVFCYSFGITLCAFFIKPESIAIKTLVRSAFPIASNQYWYVSCFMALFILKPWLNKMLRSLNNIDLTKLVCVLFTSFSLFMVFAGRLSGADPFVLNYGYSTIWLMILYVIWAWMKRVNIINRIKLKYAWLSIFLGTLVSWLFKDLFSGFLQTGVLVDYISPTILLSAMAYIIIFAKMNPNNIFKKIISCFAPAAFGVYLIHEQPILREHFMKNSFSWIANLPVLVMVGSIIGCALCILVICLMIEKVRLFLFKILKINLLIASIGSRIDGLLDRTFNQLT